MSYRLLLTLILSVHIARSWSHYTEEASLIQITEPIDHAEGPIWLEEEQALYYVDIAGHGVHRYDPYTRKHTFITLNNTVSFVIPIEGHRGKFAIGYGTSLTILNWDGISKTYTLDNKFSVDQGKIGNRFNDAKGDISGRLWMGTMGEEINGKVNPDQGSFFRVATNCEVTTILSRVSISNGITWNAKNTRMFYIDSPTRKIDVFDYNVCNGEVANRRPFFEFDKYNLTGVPDGMTIDEEDNLWIANWGGGRVLQVSSEGWLKRILEFPVERVTSVAFGEFNYGTLFVTTMRFGLNQTQLENQPMAGSVFKVVGLPVRGRRQYYVTPCLLQ